MNTKPVQIIFTGDVAFSKYFQNGWDGDGCISNQVASFLKSADHVVTNVESPVTASEIAMQKALTHVSDPRAAHYMSQMNMKYWTLANNHIMDCGERGLRDTIIHAKEEGCYPFGAGMDLAEASQPLILGEETKAGIISVTNYSQSLMADENKAGALTWKNEDAIRSVIQELKASVDWVVAIAHSGDEFCDIPMPYTRNRYLSLLDMGADIVIAHHPHIVQNYERIDHKMIFYSLGNFLFDTDNQRTHPHTENGVLVKIEFRKKTYTTEYYGIRINRERALVEKSDIPPIFTDIDRENYELLWPLAARRFYPVDLAKRKTFKKDYQNRSAPAIFVKEIKLLKNRKKRTVQVGRIRSLFGGWKRSSLKDVIQYVRNG